MKTVGVCILGRDRDQSKGKKDERWNQFRPSVAFPLQKDIKLDIVYLLYEKGKQELLDTVVKDIESISNGLPKIVTKKILFKDPFDFGTCYSVLNRTLVEIAEKDVSEVYLNVNAGTHTMQFAMYYIVIIASQVCHALVPGYAISVFAQRVGQRANA